MAKLKLFPPDDFLGAHGFPNLGPYKYKVLAQGDSWFSIGALLAPKTTNILEELELAASFCAVNCARPGATMHRMVKQLKEPKFRALLTGNQAWHWDGIFMSAGGNDLIDAIQVLPTYAKGVDKGKPVPPKLRILLKANEWKPGTSADRYISDDGWKTFADHLRASFDSLLAMRDGGRSQSKGAPVFVHCYDYLLPRNAPAGVKSGPWLYPAVIAYAIPATDWAALGASLINKLRTLLEDIATNVPDMHVVATTPGTLIAAVKPSGPSNDWENEIHPTPEGYRKIADKYAAVVNQRLP